MKALTLLGLAGLLVLETACATTQNTNTKLPLEEQVTVKTTVNDKGKARTDFFYNQGTPVKTREITTIESDAEGRTLKKTVEIGGTKWTHFYTRDYNGNILEKKVIEECEDYIAVIGTRVSVTITGYDLPCKDSIYPREPESNCLAKRECTGNVSDDGTITLGLIETWEIGRDGMRHNLKSRGIEDGRLISENSGVNNPPDTTIYTIDFSFLTHVF